ncbi:DNA polymerase III subunit psi [Thalassotalea eurytherma]|uniref:DNA polymerase III subunit psi n=1 Tax=Thalassotalea eurytherma TaxID=1144278 RepID=UPI0024E0ED8B|nr:DNA polymerase III subunit psi [Thalassotalea eurytherma]
MTISQRQYDILNEIGIDLWQAKTSTKQKHVSYAEISKIDYEQLVQTQLFQDILMAMNIDTDQHQLVSGHIDLGLINWQFSQENTCYYQDQLLVTPSLDDIKQSSQLKRQLWQTINELRT